MLQVIRVEVAAVEGHSDDWLADLPSVYLPEMLHDGIRTRIDQTDVPVVVPPDEEGRGAGLPSHLKNLGISIVLPHVVALNDEPFPNLRLHGFPFPSSFPRFLPQRQCTKRTCTLAECKTL